MTFDQWKALAVDIDPDPANTEEYEYALFSPRQIRLASMMRSSSCRLLFIVVND